MRLTDTERTILADLEQNGPASFYRLAFKARISRFRVSRILRTKLRALVHIDDWELVGNHWVEIWALGPGTDAIKRLTSNAESCKRWRQANRGKAAAYKREVYWAKPEHREQRKAYMRQWYAAHRKQELARNKERYWARKGAA